MKDPWKLQVGALILGWAVALAAMVQSWRRDPPDPRLTGTAAYGHNGEDALVNVAIGATVELIVLLIFLAPLLWGRRGYLRHLPALLLSPWWLINGFALMHAGGISFVHFLWLSWAGVVVAFGEGWLGVSWLKRRMAARP